MKISVITAVYNCASTVEETILSVIDQRHPDVEHVIVDGASNDGTLDVIERYRGAVAAFISEPDGGIYHGMNKGLEMATGDVIGFLNGDDIYIDETVLESVAQLLDDPAVDACYSDLIYVGQCDTRKIIRYWKSRDFTPGLFKDGWMPAHPTFFVKRDIYDRLGGFDLEFTLQSDFELTMRFMELGAIRSVYVPRVWVRMRMGGVTSRKLSNVLKGNVEAYRACRKNGLDVTPFFIVRKIMSRVPQFIIKPSGN